MHTPVFTLANGHFAVTNVVEDFADRPIFGAINNFTLDHNIMHQKGLQGRSGTFPPGIRKANLWIRLLITMNPLLFFQGTLHQAYY